MKLAGLLQSPALAAIAVLFAGEAAHSASGPPHRPTRATFETAGPGDVVQGAVVAGGAAGVVLWPAPSAVEGRVLPAGSLVVAAHATLTQALAGFPDLRPIVLPGPSFLAVGAEAPAGGEARLLAALRKLASPPSPPSGAIAAAVVDAKRAAATGGADPVLRARLAALGVLFPRGTPPGSGAGSPATLDQVDVGAVHAALEAVRRREVQVRVAGGPGFAARTAEALVARIGPRADTGASPARFAAGSVFVAASPGATPPDAGITLAYRISRDDVQKWGFALPLLAETLRAGAGSLPQRLRVALGQDVYSLVELVEASGGEAVFILATRAPRGSAASAWRVLDGTVTSLVSLAMNEDAVFRARQRLDEQASRRPADARSALLDLLQPDSWRWPPADRWERPISAPDLLKSAQAVFRTDRRAAAVAGGAREELASIETLRAAKVVTWSDQGALTDSGESLADTPGADDQAARAQEYARERLRGLAAGAGGSTPPGFRARYRIREQTPLGPAETELVVESGAERAAVDLSTARWRIQVRASDDGAEASIPEANGAAALPEADRLAAIALREPVALIGEVARGDLPATLTRTPCGEQSCDGLRVELGEGSVLALTLDPAGSPLSLRVWFLGREKGRPADEEVTYPSWREAGGVRLAGEMTIRDVLGVERTQTLAEWTWLDR